MCLYSNEEIEELTLKIKLIFCFSFFFFLFFPFPRIEKNYKKMARFSGVVWKTVDRSPGSITCFSIAVVVFHTWLLLILWESLPSLLNVFPTSRLQKKKKINKSKYMNRFRKAWDESLHLSTIYAPTHFFFFFSGKVPKIQNSRTIRLHEYLGLPII